ncbi:MAG TPA: FAD:protein FMN transferase [Pirellulales bacterium]|jgi:thiamine biosynthesis lipoprotein
MIVREVFRPWRAIAKPAMKRCLITAWRRALRSLLLCHAMLLLVCAGQAGAAERFEFSRIKMGAPFKLVLYADDQAAADRAAEAAYGRVDELNMIFSDYQPDSELSRLSRASPTREPVKLSDPLWAILVRARALSEASDGAFDVTVGPYVRLWRRARKLPALPDVAALAQAGKAVGYQNLVLDPATHTATLLREHMLLDLGGIAMGYTVDEVLGVLARQGIRQALVDGSGDIGVGDPPPGKPGWTIGIAPPTAGEPPTRYVTLANTAITTSGDMFQHVDIGGVRYSHIVNPKTGLGLTDQTSVTLIARDCLTADSVTKAIAVNGPEKGLKMVAEIPGAEVLIRRMVGAQMETYESPGFKAFAAEPEPAASEPAASR